MKGNNSLSEKIVAGCNLLRKAEIRAISLTEADWAPVAANAAPRQKGMETGRDMRRAEPEREKIFLFGFAVTS
jgi:hypothetical protein